MVVFAERVATLHWLRDRLRKDLKLSADQVRVLHGGLSDVEQQEIVAGSQQARQPHPVALTHREGVQQALAVGARTERIEGHVDPGLVNVLYTPAGGQTATLPQNENCTGPGWHYDNPAMPTKIIFCPESCQTVKEDFNAQVQILLGCKTEIAK